MMLSEMVRGSVWQVLSISFILSAFGHGPAQAATCTPTPWDEIGPFYKPNAPVRSSIGKGYLLAGTVRSSADCSPIANARIEVWQVGPDGRYDDAHRATLYSDKQGRYQLESNFPPPYARRPSHIHLLVDAAGYQGLVTQHYPKKGARQATFDLVLEPESADAAKPGAGSPDLVRPRQQR